MVSPEEQVLREERVRLLLPAARAACTTGQWSVLVRLYGLEGESPRTMPQLALELGVTPERIKQRRDSALKRCRICIKPVALGL